MNNDWIQNLRPDQQAQLKAAGGGLDYVKFMGWENNINPNGTLGGTADWYTKALADQQAIGNPAPQQLGQGLTNNNDALLSAQQNALQQQQIRTDPNNAQGLGLPTPPSTTTFPNAIPQIGALNQGAIPTTNNGVGNSTSGTQFLPGQIGASFGNISQPMTPQDQQRQAIKTDPNNITGYQDINNNQ